MADYQGRKKKDRKHHNRKGIFFIIIIYIIYIYIYIYYSPLFAINL